MVTPAPPKNLRNSLRVIELAVNFFPNQLGEPTGQQRKEQADGNSHRHNFRPEKGNLPHDNTLEAEKRPGRQIRNQGSHSHPDFEKKRRDNRKVSHWSMDLLKMTRKFCRGAIDEFQAAIETVNTERRFFKEKAVARSAACRAATA
jgi:hypothetical protein